MITIGTVLTRPDGKTATVTAISESETTIAIDEWTAPDLSVEPACTWTGHPCNLVNCWNVQPA